MNDLSPRPNSLYACFEAIDLRRDYSDYYKEGGWENTKEKKMFEYPCLGRVGGQENIFVGDWLPVLVQEAEGMVPQILRHRGQV
jgi:hypothetical protein